MIIDAMVQREDFYNINEVTLKRYFSVVQGKDVDLKTKSYNPFGRIFIYPHLGSIMTRVPDRRIRKYWLNEYNVRNNIPKYIAAKLYVYACFFSFGLLAGKELHICGDQVFDSSIVIIPVNRKIRIYNFGTGCVDAIVKDSFSNKYFNNELTFRLNNKYDFVLPIIAHGNDWYREKILPGQPLARLKSKQLYSKCTNEVVEFIGILANDTLRYVDAMSYSNNLYDEIMRKISLARDNKKIGSYEKVVAIAVAALNSATLLNAPLPTVVSHGDLQSGNVWVDVENNRTYIIDWETHERRSIWYDCATLLLSTRRANKLKEMMVNCESDAIKRAVLMNDNNKRYYMRAVMGIITLEDIMFYLDDMLELPQDFGGAIFDRIAGELDMMGWRQ